MNLKYDIYATIFDILLKNNKAAGFRYQATGFRLQELTFYRKAILNPKSELRTPKSFC
jgi:hypothetical protein